MRVILASDSNGSYLRCWLASILQHSELAQRMLLRKTRTTQFYSSSSAHYYYHAVYTYYNMARLRISARSMEIRHFVHWHNAASGIFFWAKPRKVGVFLRAVQLIEQRPQAWAHSYLLFSGVCSFHDRRICVLLCRNLLP